MRMKFFAAVFASALLAGSSVAFAQSSAPSAGPSAGPSGSFCNCAKVLLYRQSLINTSTSIRNLIVSRFDEGADKTEPAGLELTDPNEILQRLSGSGVITIAPTADLTAPAATSKWNLWTDGKYSWLDDTSAASNLDGGLVNLIIGGDHHPYCDKYW